MRRLRGDARGLSEIVGTLILVLIVVSAATVFAAFVATYEKQLLAQEAVTHQRSLESLVVFGISLQAQNNLPNLIANLSFTVASETVDTVMLSGLTVNGNEVTQWNYTDLSTGAPASGVVPVALGISIPPFDKFEISLDVNVSSLSYSLATAASIPLTSYLEISAFTTLSNEFTAVFLPPTAIALVSLGEIYNASSGTYSPEPMLDGTTSFQTGNATILKWSWNVTNATTTSLFTGEEVPDPQLTSGGPFTITLTLTNSDGLMGTDTIVYPPTS